MADAVASRARCRHGNRWQSAGPGAGQAAGGGGAGASGFEPVQLFGGAGASGMTDLAMLHALAAPPPGNLRGRRVGEAATTQKQNNH